MTFKGKLVGRSNFQRVAIRQMSRQNQPSVNPFCNLDRNRSSAIMCLTTSLRDATTSFWEPLLRLDCLRRRLDRVAVWYILVLLIHFPSSVANSHFKKKAVVAHRAFDY